MPALKLESNAPISRNLDAVLAVSISNKAMEPETRNPEYLALRVFQRHLSRQAIALCGRSAECSVLCGHRAGKISPAPYA